VFATFAEKIATVRFYMANQRFSFHGEGTKGSFVTLLPASDFSASSRFAICFQNQGGGFLEVFSGFFQGCALGIGAGKFFQEGDVAFGDLHIDGGELHQERSFGPRCGVAARRPSLYTAQRDKLVNLNSIGLSSGNALLTGTSKSHATLADQVGVPPWLGRRGEPFP